MQEHKYKLVVSPKVQKSFKKLSKQTADKVWQRIYELLDNPRPHGYTKLSDDRYRIRQGDYRVIYTIHDQIVTVTVVKVGHRQE